MTRAARAVLFDVDGTLVDSNDAHAHAWIDVFREFGREKSIQEIRPLIGMGGDHLLPTAIGLDHDTPEAEAMGKRRGEIFRTRYLPHLQPFGRVRELLERLRDDGYTLVVASSAEDKELHAILAVTGAADLFTETTSASDAEHSKPSPDIVEAAVRTTGLDAEQCIMVGDTPYDVEAATRAGVPIVGVGSGGWTADKLAGAIEVYASVGDIADTYAVSVFARRAIG